MPIVDLGKLGFAWKGEYSDATQYEAKDIVRHVNSIYQCTATPPAGTPPSVAAYWAVWVDGDAGSLAAGLFAKADTDSAAFEKTGAQTINVKAGTKVELNGAIHAFPADTAVMMPDLTPGHGLRHLCVRRRDGPC